MREFVGVDGVLSCCVSDRGSFATAKRPLAGGIWPVISRPSMPDASAAPQHDEDEVESTSVFCHPERSEGSGTCISR